MPTYQYACTACGHELEAVQSFSDEALTQCPACEGRLRKVFSAVGIVFKGSGFYRTDSRGDKSSSTVSTGSNGGKESTTASSGGSDSSSASAASTSSDKGGTTTPKSEGTATAKKAAATAGASA